MRTIEEKRAAYLSGWNRWVDLDSAENITDPWERKGFADAGFANEGGGNRPTKGEGLDYWADNADAIVADMATAARLAFLNGLSKEDLVGLLLATEGTLRTRADEVRGYQATIVDLDAKLVQARKDWAEALEERDAEARARARASEHGARMREAKEKAEKENAEMAAEILTLTQENGNLLADLRAVRDITGKWFTQG